METIDCTQSFKMQAQPTLESFASLLSKHSHFTGYFQVKLSQSGRRSDGSDQEISGNQADRTKVKISIHTTKFDGQFV